MTAAVEPVIHIASTRPIAPLANSGKQGEIRICSVYPVERRASRRHNRYTEYILPAAPREGYSLCVVFDTFEAITTWSEDGPGQNRITPGHIPVQVVAIDLVNTWASQTIASQAGHGPGIGQIAGDLPTEAELAFLREKQRAFFEWLVQDANDKHLRGEQRNITGTHRQAAYWLLGDAAQQLPWYPKMEQRTVKDCPRCARQILSAALGCEHCGLDLIDWYQKYTHLTRDPFVANFLEGAKSVAAVAAAVPEKPVEASGAERLDQLRAENQRLRDPKAPRQVQS